MDWVKERQNRKPKRKVARGCLHIASAYNQSTSIDFLLNKNTLDIWLKHVPSDDSDNPMYVFYLFYFYLFFISIFIYLFLFLFLFIYFYFVFNYLFFSFFVYFLLQIIYFFIIKN